jgi:hypothetical protein
VSRLTDYSDEHGLIAIEIDDPMKDETAVRAYAKVFWKRYKEITGTSLTSQ